MTVVERISIDWPDELERIAGESGNPGGYEAGQLRAAAKAWRAERERAGKVEAACGRFAGFLAWVEALAELGDIDPPTDRTAICQLSGGGGSDALTVGDLRRAAEALAAAGRDRAREGRQGAAGGHDGGGADGSGVGGGEANAGQTAAPGSGSVVLLVCNVRRGAFSGEFYYSLLTHGDPEPVVGTAPIGDLVELPGCFGSRITCIRGLLLREYDGLSEVLIRDLQTTQRVVVMSSDVRRQP